VWLGTQGPLRKDLWPPGGGAVSPGAGADGFPVNAGSGVPLMRRCPKVPSGSGTLSLARQRLRRDSDSEGGVP
jgi:hypothetical protein